MDHPLEIKVEAMGPALIRLPLAFGEGLISFKFGTPFEDMQMAEYEIVWDGDLPPLVEKLRAIHATDMHIAVVETRTKLVKVTREQAIANGTYPYYLDLPDTVDFHLPVDYTIKNNFRALAAFEEWAATADA